MPVVPSQAQQQQAQKLLQQQLQDQQNKNKKSTAKLNQNAETAYQVTPGPIQIFLDKFKDWKFNFPSKNLWTIEIKLHNDGSSSDDHSMLKLYQNIDSANRRWKSMIGNIWSISTRSAEDFANNFLNQFQEDKTAFFLAQGISFDLRGVNVNTNTSDLIATHSGFLKFGMVENGANYNPQCRVQFYETNWDVGDIFFDKWIAAIAQQGLIEDSSLPCIKADIHINQYSAGVSTKTVALNDAVKAQQNSKNKAISTPQQIQQTQKKNATWTLRKIIKLYGAVPINRSGSAEISYENNGPTVETVTFQFLDYSVEYLI